MRKIKSIIIFFIAGLSFVNANENALSILENSKVDTRRVGYELCKIYTQKNKSFFENWLYRIKPEEEIARELKNDANLNSAIFSGHASDDPLIKDLQEGCFDFLLEEVEDFLFNGHFLKILQERVDILSCQDPKELIIKVEPIADDIELCNESQLELREKAGLSSKVFYFKLLKLLGLSDRSEVLKQKTKEYYERHGFDFEDDDEDSMKSKEDL